METKDIIGISISSLALAFSIFATIYSNKKAKENKHRTIRELLTNILDNLVSLHLDTIQLKIDHKSDVKFLFELNALIRQKQGFLLEEASYLARQIPEHIQTYESDTIACGHLGIGNKEEAEEFFLMGIAKAKNDREQALAKSSYTALLFQTDRHDEARKTFQNAIALLNDSDNLSKEIRGNIYKMWSASEFTHAASIELATLRLQNAFEEYSRITFTAKKNDLLANLATLSQTIHTGI